MQELVCKIKIVDEIMEIKEEKILDQILWLAYDMLEAGAEVGWTERKVCQLCKAYEMEEVEVFIITSSIVVSAKGKSGRIHTQTRRIRQYQTDFWKLQLLEKLMHKIEESTLEEKEIENGRKEIEKILAKRREKWKGISQYLIFCFTCMVFTMFFGGGIREGIASALCGLGVKLVLEKAGSLIQNKFAINLLVSALSGLEAYFFVKIGWAYSVEPIIMGNIMLLIPGLAMVNALYDLISGDMLTGLLRLADALTQAAAIALGFGFVLLQLT